MPQPTVYLSVSDIQAAKMKAIRKLASSRNKMNEAMRKHLQSKQRALK
jgi:hypothetical protein